MRLERGSSHAGDPALEAMVQLQSIAIDCNLALVTSHETCQERPLHFLLTRAKGRAKDVENETDQAARQQTPRKNCAAVASDHQRHRAAMRRSSVHGLARTQFCNAPS